MLNLEQWSQKTLTQVEKQLDLFLSQPSKCNLLLEAMRYSSLDGGKRIRPQFTIAAGSISGANEDTLIKIGSAIELIHCFSLIHDDLPIMDNDDLRRGRPTNHKVFGEAVALLAGDALHAICFEILSDPGLNLEPQKKLEIINLVAKSIGLQGMVGGQTIDWLSTNTELDLERLSEMHLLKTGALLRASILSGYLAGPNTNPAQRDYLEIVAKKIGLLFQIVDDIIDVTQDTVTLGKTANKDLKDNKATYVNILGLEKAQEIANRLYLEINNDLSKEKNSEQLIYLANFVYKRNS